ncbi:hypothetical protein DL546_004589 [Coniochaeta pulveracea]|uniref:Tetratricopeptide SHNi-TPR domain-containing protein n=1 Tax=Coniochaeta pulveracea TaxID=177199 RepID=A0A420YCP1_9PEZI|nr:hypothetical protein DL546_004589 [Coniochaeta pulveracea]
MASNDEQPTTAVTAAVAPETTDTSAAAETTGTTSLVGDIAQTAASAASSLPTTPGIATAGTVTPFELDERQRRLSLDVSLADLCAKATALYAQKKYEDAADIFSRATEMQAEMNGEMNPKNAEILFLYGRALYKVGQSKSDVLGGAAPVTEGEGAKKGSKKKANGEAKKAADGAEPEKIIEKAIAGAADDATEPKSADVDNKPLIQIEGDEDSDEEMDDEEGEDGAEEEDDDFETAFQVLDLARVLFTKELEEEQQQADTEEGKGKDVSEGDSPKVRHIKERLADAHDLLAEISLENEKYLIPVS